MHIRIFCVLVQTIIQDAFHENSDELAEVLPSCVWSDVSITLKSKLLESVQGHLRYNKYTTKLVEDGNGQSEIVAAFMVLQETESTFSKMVDLFKKHNSSWECVHVIMTDKKISILCIDSIS